MSIATTIFGKTTAEDKQLKKSLKNILGFSPNYLPFYVNAITHRSNNENLSQNNERLEFLGDAFIGSIIGAYLFKKYPNKDEGYLTEMRSKIVSRQSLNDIALKMGIQKIVRFNQHDRMLRRSNIFGNALEALVGAIYLDKGFDKTQKFILKNLIRYYVDMDDLESTEHNFKNKLYNWAQLQGKSLDFVTLGETKEDGRRVFNVGIQLDGVLVMNATGYNKKQAGQTAAQKALELLTASSVES